MPTSNSRNGLHFAAIVAMLIVTSIRTAESSAITSSIDYSTTGTIGSDGVSGTAVVSYRGVNDGTLTTGGSSFDLGTFAAAQPSDGKTTTYNNTPFEIAFTAKSVDGVSTPDVKSTIIQGWLNGTIDAGGHSNLAVNFNSLPGYPSINDSPMIHSSITAPFVIGNLKYYLDQAPGPQVVFEPYENGGSTLYSMQSVIYPPEVVPEPSTIVLFACTACLPILRRLRRARGVQ